MNGGAPGQRELGTVLFVDVVDSTRRLLQVGDQAWAAVLDGLEEACRKEVESRHGRVVKTTGDGILAAMPTPTSAVECALALHEDAQGLGLALRAGVHCGELQGRGDDVAGATVHLAARLMGRAAPGETLVSNIVVLMATPDLGAFEPRGPLAMKGFASPVETFALQTVSIVPAAAVGGSSTEAVRRHLALGKFDLASELAREVDDIAQVADAVLETPDRSEFLAVNLGLTRLMEDVLERLRPEEFARRGRLESRIAFELRGDPTTLEERRRRLAEATELAERSGDLEVLADVLLARAHALWEPAGAPARLEALDRVIEVVRRGRLLDRELDARLARVDVLVELGRVADAEFELTTYGRLAPAHRRDRQAFLASRRATIAMVRGRFDDVMALAAETVEHAEAAGMPDAQRIGMSLRVLVVIERGIREAIQAAADQVLDLAGRLPGHYFEATAARCLLELGETDRARAELARAMPALLTTFGFRWTWSACDAARVAVEVGSDEQCAQLLDALSARGGRFVVLGATFGGATSTFLGMLASRLGRTDEALAHLDRAVSELDAIAALPWGAYARAARAQIRRQIGHPGAADDDRTALETARAVGMAALVAKLEARQGATRIWFLLPEADGWAIGADDETAHLRNMRGLEQLRTLLANPGEDIPALALESGGAVTWAPPGPEMLDDIARAAYRARLRAIAAELDAADQAGNSERSRALVAEQGHLLAELQRATGLGGRARRSSDEVERARVNVTRNLRRVIGQIAEVAPATAAHLAASIRTGAACRYEPVPGGPERWRT